MDLTFINTCPACPEQYDVLNTEGEQVAYIRLRYGRLRVIIPNVGGIAIYVKEFDDNLKGVFSTQEERIDHLSSIARAIRNYYEYLY